MDTISNELNLFFSAVKKVDTDQQLDDGWNDKNEGSLALAKQEQAELTMIIFRILMTL
jgi:hypothetical protein